MDSSDVLQLYFSEDYTIHTRFRGQTLEWDGSLYDKANYVHTDFDLFKEINSFLVRQPVSVSETIFNSYKKIHDLIFEGGTLHQQTIAIIREVRRLAAAWNFDAMRRHVLLTSGVVIPASLEREYSQPESINSTEGLRTQKSKQSSTPEKTYLYDDYVELVGFTILVRLMTPIFGAFIDQFGNESGTSFKEYNAGQFLAACPNVVESKAYQKLLTYISAITERVEKKDNTVMDGLAREDFPQWVFNLVLVRRITIGDVRGIAVSSSGAPTSLITFIHNYISQRVIKNPESFSLRKLRDKNVSSNKNQDDESKLTDFEAVRISEESSPGSIRELQFYFTREENIIRAICPHLDLNLLAKAKEANTVLDTEIIHPPQIRIAQWMLGPYLPPRSLLNVEKEVERRELVNYISICQAILWQHGFKDLAAIISLTEYRSRTPARIAQITRSNIPAALVEEARTLFRHTKRASGRSLATKPEPIPVTLVKTMTNELLDREWRLNLPRGWDIVPVNPTGLRPREYRIPSDIRIQLMTLVNRIGKNRNPFHEGAKP